MAEARDVGSSSSKTTSTSSRTSTSSSSSSKTTSSSSSSSSKSTSSSRTTSSSSSTSSTRTKQTPSTSSTRTKQTPSSTAKTRKVAEMEALGNSVTNAGISLEKASNLLATAMQELWKGLTGNTANTINKMLDTAQESVEAVINKFNSIGNDISEKIKAEGENYNFNNLTANSEKTSNSSKDTVFGIDTNYLTNTVKPLLDSAKGAVKDAWNEIVNSPKVDGYKNVSGESEEISIIENLINSGLNILNEINATAEKIENKAKDTANSIGNKVGNLVGTMLGAVVPTASAAEYDGTTTNGKTDDNDEGILSKIGNNLTEFVDDAKDVVASVGADVLNTGAQAIKGVAEFAGGLLDAGAIVGTGFASIGTLLYDGINYLITGEESSTTEQMWEDTMAFVAEEHVEAAYKDFYEAPLGSWIEENAHDAFKSDGVVSDIASGLGKVAGVIGLTVLTMGAGTVVTGGATIASGSATISTTGVTSLFAGTSAFGDYTGEYWENSNDESTGEKLFKGLGYGIPNGAWEAAQWYVGGKLNNLNINGGNNLVTSAVRVAIDTGFNALDTPARALMDMIVTDKTFEEAFEDQGGWTSVITNGGIGLIGSVGGEIFDIKKSQISDPITQKVNAISAFDDLNPETARNLKDNIIRDVKLGIVDERNLQSFTQDALIDEFNKKYPNTLIDGKRKLETDLQIAEYFNDPYGFISAKQRLFGFQVAGNSRDDLIQQFYDGMDVEDKNTFVRLFANKRVFSEEAQNHLYAFSRANGPYYSAYSRDTVTEFQGHSIDGTNKESCETALKLANTIFDMDLSTDIDGNLRKFDGFIENSQPVIEDIILSRNVSDLYMDNEKIYTFEPGIKFNDNAMLSTSANNAYSFNDRKIKLEIEVPKGEKVAYIQSEVAYKRGNNQGMSYKQQEVLIGRNRTYEITDMVRFDSRTGQVIIRSRLVP